MGLIELAFAYVLDLAIGDPQWSYHPVRLIGRAIEGMEYLVRKLPIPERISGILLTMIIVSGTYLSIYAVMLLSRQWSKLGEIIIGAVILYFTKSRRNSCFLPHVRLASS